MPQRPRFDPLSIAAIGFLIISLFTVTVVINNKGYIASFYGQAKKYVGDKATQAYKAKKNEDEAAKAKQQAENRAAALQEKQAANVVYQERINSENFNGPQGEYQKILETNPKFANYVDQDTFKNSFNNGTVIPSIGMTAQQFIDSIKVNTTTSVSNGGSGQSCNANGTAYAVGSVVVYSSGANDYRRCGSDGLWIADSSLKITDLTPAYVPTYLKPTYDTAIKTQQNITAPAAITPTTQEKTAAEAEADRNKIAQRDCEAGNAIWNSSNNSCSERPSLPPPPPPVVEQEPVVTEQKTFAPSLAEINNVFPTSKPVVVEAPTYQRKDLVSPLSQADISLLVALGQANLPVAAKSVAPTTNNSLRDFLLPKTQQYQICNGSSLCNGLLSTVSNYNNDITFGGFSNYTNTYQQIANQNPQANYLQQAINPQGVAASARLGGTLVGEGVAVIGGGAVISSIVNLASLGGTAGLAATLANVPAATTVVASQIPSWVGTTLLVGTTAPALVSTTKCLAGYCTAEEQAQSQEMAFYTAVGLQQMQEATVLSSPTIKVDIPEANGTRFATADELAQIFPAQAVSKNTPTSNMLFALNEVPVTQRVGTSMLNTTQNELGVGINGIAGSMDDLQRTVESAASNLTNRVETNITNNVVSGLNNVDDLAINLANTPSVVRISDLPPEVPVVVEPQPSLSTKISNWWSENVASPVENVFVPKTAIVETPVTAIDPNLGYEDLTQSPLFKNGYLNIKGPALPPEKVNLEIQKICQELPTACSENALSPTYHGSSSPSLFGVFNEDPLPIKSLADLTNAGDPVFSEARFSTGLLDPGTSGSTGGTGVVSVSAISPRSALDYARPVNFSPEVERYNLSAWKEEFKTTQSETLDRISSLNIPENERQTIIDWFKAKLTYNQENINISAGKINSLLDKYENTSLFTTIDKVVRDANSTSTYLRNTLARTIDITERQLTAYPALPAWQKDLLDNSFPVVYGIKPEVGRESVFMSRSDINFDMGFNGGFSLNEIENVYVPKSEISRLESLWTQLHPDTPIPFKLVDIDVLNPSSGISQTLVEPQPNVLQNAWENFTGLFKTKTPVTELPTAAKPFLINGQNSLQSPEEAVGMISGTTQNGTRVLQPGTNQSLYFWDDASNTWVKTENLVLKDGLQISYSDSIVGADEATRLNAPSATVISDNSGKLYLYNGDIYTNNSIITPLQETTNTTNPLSRARSLIKIISSENINSEEASKILLDSGYAPKDITRNLVSQIENLDAPTFENGNFAQKAKVLIDSVLHPMPTENVAIVAAKLNVPEDLTATKLDIVDSLTSAFAKNRNKIAFLGLGGTAVGVGTDVIVQNYPAIISTTQNFFSSVQKTVNGWINGFSALIPQNSTSSILKAPVSQTGQTDSINKIENTVSKTENVNTGVQTQETVNQKSEDVNQNSQNQQNANQEPQGKQNNFSVFMQTGNNTIINQSGDTLATEGCAPTTAYNILNLLGKSPNLNQILKNFYWNCTGNKCSTSADATLFSLQQNGLKGTYDDYESNKIVDADMLKNYTGILVYGGTVYVGDKKIAHVAGFSCQVGICVSIDSYFGDGKPVSCGVINSSTVRCGDANYHVGNSGGVADAFYPVVNN